MSRIGISLLKAFTFFKKIDEISIIDLTNQVDYCNFNLQFPSFDSSGLLRAGSLPASVQPQNENGLANNW